MTIASHVAPSEYRNRFAEARCAATCARMCKVPLTPVTALQPAPPKKHWNDDHQLQKEKRSGMLFRLEIELQCFLAYFRTVFNWVLKIISRLLWICLYCTLCECEWLAKFAPVFQPVGSQTKTNGNFSALTHFPALDAGCMYLLQIVIGSLLCLRLL